MTVFTTPGWLQNAGAVHSAQQMRNYAGSMMLAGAGGATTMQPRGGVHPTLGNRFQVTQTGSPSMAVVVKSGLCAIPGTESVTQGTYGLGNDGDVTLSIAAAHATLPRIDIAIGRIRDSAFSGGTNSGVLEIVTGTAASSPVAPATPANSLVYAQVNVPAAATSISNANITDVRIYAAGSGGVIPALSTNAFTNLLHAGQPVYETDTGRLKVATDTGANFKTVFTGINVQRFTSSGTWNKPSGASRVLVQVQGSGGAGGGAATTSAGQTSAGAGGEAGAYAESWYDASALTASVTVTIGAGGTGVVAGTGNNGATSSFGAFVSAAGGAGAGFAGASGTVAVFGAARSTQAMTGDFQMAGGGGGSGFRLGSTGASGGAGGNSWFGRGGASNGPGGTGVNGTGYGGGGGGSALNPSATQTAGGNGANGIVVVTTFL